MLTCCAASGAAGGSGALTVHEWGTFLVMQGSDGVTLDGMYHEEHALPGFVHARGRDQLRIPRAVMKGETPVIYFYTEQPRQVRVKVGFPSGIWTQWYPQASRLEPSITSTVPGEPRGGSISWDAQLIPAGTGKGPSLPLASSDALWNFARDVDAAYVETRDRVKGPQSERFIFYRGLGTASLPIKMSMESGGALTQDSSLQEEVRHVFVLRVENGKGAYRYLPQLKPGQQLERVLPTTAEARPLKEFTRKIGDNLAARLVEAGLYPKEARAMVNTWSTSYFQSDGIRALFVMPQRWTDDFIPMQIEPRPASLVRVMVGRLEMLTPEREARAEAAVRELSSASTEKRDRAFEFLREQGRYAEPVIRRVRRTSKDESVRQLCERLLSTGFVTDLRTSTKSAETGATVSEKPLHLRAQLSSLLWEVGLAAEARATGAGALAELKRTPEPSMDVSGSRHYYRALARATEAAGSGAADAAQAYAKFVRFGANVKKCGGCHEAQGPKTMAWYRDWWAGRRFAQHAKRSGKLDEWLSTQQRALQQDPGNTTAQMLLAYLYEAKGQAKDADGMWAMVTGPNRRVAGR